jgi:hypothetical protein
MKIRELSAALSDLDEALGHYGNISPFFAQALMDEVVSAKRLIAEYPLAWKHAIRRLARLPHASLPLHHRLPCNRRRNPDRGLCPFQAPPELLEAAPNNKLTRQQK